MAFCETCKIVGLPEGDICPRCRQCFDCCTCYEEAQAEAELGADIDEHEISEAEISAAEDLDAIP